MEQLDDTWKLMAFFAIATGVRQGEQRALVWGDIDFEGNKIWISKAVEHLTHKIKAPKTENGNKCIDLLPELKSQLQELYMRSGRPNDTERVFLIEGKAPCKQSFIRTMGAHVSKPVSKASAGMTFATSVLRICFKHTAMINGTCQTSWATTAQKLHKPFTVTGWKKKTTATVSTSSQVSLRSSLLNDAHKSHRL